MIAEPATPEPRARTKSEETALARDDADATELFEDGQTRLRAGKYGTATLAFQTLLAVYPESPLAARAAAAMKTAEDLEQAQSNTRILRSLRFENLPGVTVQAVLQRFSEHEIELAVEKPCTSRVLDDAKAVLQDFLAENGVVEPRVEVASRDLPPRSLEITFRLAKN